jgi:hypothetical protein
MTYLRREGLRGGLGFCLKATGNPTTLRTLSVAGGRKGTWRWRCVKECIGNALALYLSMIVSVGLESYIWGGGKASV